MNRKQILGQCLWLAFVAGCGGQESVVESTFETDIRTAQIACMERSPEELELLRAIALAPAAREPRLAYAKWLDDRDPARAEVIRTHVEVEGLEHDDPRQAELRQRIAELVERHQETWMQPIAVLLGRQGSADVRRGYVDRLECSDVTDAGLACLASVPAVRELTVHSGRITKVGAARIAALPNVVRVSLGEVELGDGALDVFAQLPPGMLFECYSQIIDRNVLRAINERRLERFEALSREEQRRAAWRYLQAASYDLLPEGPIKTATLSQAGVNDSQMRFFTALPGVEEIHISETDRLTAKGLESLKNIEHLRRLELWDTTVETLAPIVQHTSLEVLNVYPEYDTVMGDAGTAGLEKLVNLEELYLTDRGIADVTMQRLAPLVKLRTLGLNIEGGIVDEASLHVLAGLVALESLSLHGADYGAVGLANFAHLENLVVLDTHVQLGDGAGLKHLAGLSKLQYLHLSGDGVTDKGLRHLNRLTGLRSIMAQKSAVTSAGANWLAERLPRVTIILDEEVVKSPRATYTLRRRQLAGVASVLTPVDWPDRAPRYGKLQSQIEDGWEKVHSVSGGKVGPASMHLYVRDAKPDETVEQAMLEVVNNNRHLNPVVIERQVVALDAGAEAASCVYRNRYYQAMVCAGRVGDKTAAFWCKAPPSRFEDFRPLFLYVARSLRLSPDANQHEPDEVEVATKNLFQPAERK